MSELKFVITGTPGVGKTTAIQSISDIPPVITDALTTDDLAEIKSTTTVAFDFGEVHLDADTIVRIYGTPGQERFRFMWDIISEGALGLIILVDNSREDPLADMQIYLDNFTRLINETGVVVGVSRLENHPSPNLDDFYQYLEAQNLHIPVMEADPRNKEDMINLMDALMAIVECG